MGAGMEHEYNRSLWKEIDAIDYGEFDINFGKTVCLCGSIKNNKEAFMNAAEVFSLEGWIVHTVHVWSMRDELHGSKRRTKDMLDRLHKMKIARSQLVFIVNPDGYYGDSTQSEIDFARSLGIPVAFMKRVSGQGEVLAKSECCKATISFWEGRYCCRNCGKILDKDNRPISLEDKPDESTK